MGGDTGMARKDDKITFTTNREIKECFNLLCEDLIAKGYFKSKTDFLESIIGWANKNRNAIDWASIRFWKTMKKDK